MHEITDKDQVVLHRERAWHGLGLVVSDAPTPREALTMIGAEWGVEQYPLFAMQGEGDEAEVIEVPSHVLNVRMDDKTPLGVVSAKYSVFQNYQLADFCEALAENDDVVKCETAGTVRGGRKIWFMLKGESFSVRGKDEICPYILASNSHDGTSTFRIDPTTIRVVCSNTLHAVIGYDNLACQAFSCRHTLNMDERIEEAKNALQLYGHSIKETRKVMDTLASKELNSEQVQAFFLENYTRDWGEIPANPQTKVEQNRRDKALSALSSFSQRWDDERELAGNTAWNALNSYTGLIQHDKKGRGKDDADRVEKRVYNNLFGLNRTRTNEALQSAFALCT